METSYLKKDKFDYLRLQEWRPEEAWATWACAFLKRFNFLMQKLRPQSH